jgi:hypothetical protein
MAQLINIEDIKALYPDEWVLLGNPIMDDAKIDVLSGIPLFHSKDKKEVCYIGRDKTSNFDKITLIYTGTFRPTRKIATLNNIKKPIVIIDKKLNGLDKVVLFPEKVEKAKKAIEKIGLPDLTKYSE